MFVKALQNGTNYVIMNYLILPTHPGVHDSFLYGEILIFSLIHLSATGGKMAVCKM